MSDFILLSDSFVNAIANLEVGGQDLMLTEILVLDSLFQTSTRN